MNYVTILGVGQIGSVIAKLLHYNSDYVVQVGDVNAEALERLKQSIPVQTFVLDVTDEAQIAQKLQGQDCVVSACPYWLNSGIAHAAAKAGASYFDLTEDVKTTNTVRKIAETASDELLFAPQCGLAPGFIGILAHHLCGHFERLDEVKLRVGALPQYPSNSLMYNLTWSTSGLINEYCNPCDTIHNGLRTQVIPLEERESFSLDGITYESFNTSGGLGTLCETLAGKVRTLNYKTVRYPGHCNLVKFLLNDLRLSERQDLVEEIFEHALPVTQQDTVLIFCTVTGWKNDRFEQVSDIWKIYPITLQGETISAIQTSTAASLCAVVDMYLSGQLKHTGFLKQEQINFNDLIANRFGHYYVEASKSSAKAHSSRQPLQSKDCATEGNDKLLTVG